MMIRWFQTLFFGQSQSARNVPHSKVLPDASQKQGLVDVVFEAIKEETQELHHLVQTGLPMVRRRNQRAKIRRRVRQSIDPSFDDPTVVEEITDKIANAAEVDPYYQKLFAEDQ